MIGNIRRALILPGSWRWNAAVRDTTAAIERFFGDTLPIEIAWCLPRRIAYWCAIRVMAHASTGKHGDVVVPDLKAIECLERWER